MRKRYLLENRGLSGLLAILLLTVTLIAGGCAPDEYDTAQTATGNPPTAGASTNVLIEPATLKGWMDQGLVNNDGAFDQRVVILDYGVYDMEDPKNGPERIKGACRVHNNDLRSRRVEGVAEAFPMVATGEQMDAVIQRLGIDENTVIVFTTDSWVDAWKDDEFSMYFATRAYWMFRYWGFPRENLKVLNGGNDAFATIFPELMTKQIPTPVTTDFSVRYLEADLQEELRFSVGDMLGLVAALDPATDLVLDARPGPYAGAGSSPAYTSSKGDFVVYDGHPEGGQTLSWMSLFKDPANGDYGFKSRSEIEALFAEKGWDVDKMTTVYCTSGYSATPLFFAVDALLGGPVRLYDGSWTQFGMYSDIGNAGGELPLGSAWGSDQYLDLTDDNYRYNIDYLKATPLPVETLVIDDDAQTAPFSANIDTDASDVIPSQMEVADLAAAPANVSVMIAPDETATTEVLISAGTLKGWQDLGLINATEGERVVILDASYEASYNKGHIPGARWLDVSSENGMTRLDGVVQTKNMLLTAEKMDALLANHGIDANTTIVITTSEMSENYYPSRVYANLRYWGFPKERIKVLNGYNHAYATMLTNASQPAAKVTTLTVAQLSGVQLDLRATLSEVMDAARDERGTAIDFRGDGSSTGFTPGLNSAKGTYVVFEGQLNNGAFYGRGNAVHVDGTFKSASVIKTAMEAAGIAVDDFTKTAPAITYCTSGYAASTGFFVMDAILEVPVMIYDGSWSQWGQMSDNAGKGGMLSGDAGDFSAWAVDNTTYMSIVNYNMDHTNGIESLNPDADLLLLLPSDEAVNQIEKADAEYKAESSDVAAPVAPPTANGGDAVVGC